MEDEILCKINENTTCQPRKKMKLTGGFKNGDRFYAVTGWSGEYTIKGIAWQLGLV
ncbi:MULTISPECIES: hypothetical protein [Klebsiella]|uniref:Uncharacterized protein n=4 Tax=Enterobacteriaceae TaxID=543 RepID=A0AAI9DS62_PLUGE|nr:MULTISPECIES: hypothetical protein [Klebsiella]EKV0918579.1 hypothetical protein [Pluralibacter gergoviae]ELA0419548.1 hypothetical protein [Klebsiella aerogenes]ELC6592116.1 hypothetical protein [Enterobacter hormaechei]EIV2103052.1 hypothetical protein [Klebsiella pneumoniae]EJD0391319.1 hypothetical protein [Klebsiella pneumoniae]